MKKSYFLDNDVHRLLGVSVARAGDRFYSPRVRALNSPNAIRKIAVAVSSTCVTASLYSTFSGLAWAGPPHPTALPQGGVVSQGQANFNVSGSVLNVDQSTQRATINWSSFDVGSGATVNFNQPNAQAATLNRVQDLNPSQIFGHINAPGQVTLINPAGVYFSPSAVLDVGALTATTLNQTDADFMLGVNRFSRDGSVGSVVNLGMLRAALGGYIALLAPEVRNEGLIVAQQGTVVLAAGEAITLNFDPSQRLASLTVQPSQIASLVANKTAIRVNEGLVILSSTAYGQLVGSVVNGGSISATSLSHTGGRILLEGDDIQLQANSVLDVRGAAAGGTVLVGGEGQGRQGIHQAIHVSMDENASIDASATRRGDGGKVVLWSNVHDLASSTEVHGRITALSGPQGGNGGHVETSGRQLVADGTVNAGRGGQWLLDPSDIVVASTGGTTTPAAIQAALNAGTNVTLDTSGGTGGSGDITVTNAIASTGSTAGSLTLLADRNITVNANVTLTGTGNGLLLKAKNNVSVAASLALQTNNADITMWSDSDGSSATTGGTVALGNSVTLNSNHGAAIPSTAAAIQAASGGGSITIGGGVASATTALGSNVPSGATGGAVAIGTSATNVGSIYSGGGNISIKANSATSTPALTFWASNTLNSGTGRIVLSGVNTGTGGGLEFPYTLNSTAYPINITSASNAAVAIDIFGASTASAAWGLQTGYRASSSIMSTVQALGTGGVSIVGTNSASNKGVTLTGTALLSASGAISVNGGAGLAFAGNSASVRPVYVGACGVSTCANSLVTSSSSNVTLTGDSVLMNTTSHQINTTGSLVVQPNGTSFASALVWPFSNLGLVGTLSGLTLGKVGNTSAITVNSAQTIGGPIHIYGGQITTNAALTATTGDIVLSGDTSSQLAFNGSGVTINADVTASNGNVSIYGRGGNNSGGSQHGVYIADAQTVSAGGNGTVTIAGVGGAASGNFNYGIYLLGNGTAPEGKIATHNGAITLTGIGGGLSSSASNYGVTISGTVVAGGSGAVDITGTGGSATGVSQYGIRLRSPGGGVVSGTVSSAGGGIRLTGTGGANGASDNDGVSLFGTVGSVGSGAITVTGTRGNANGSGTTSSDGIYVNGVGSGVSTLGVAGYASDITLNTDALNFSAAAKLTGNGVLTIAPLTNTTTIGVGGGAGVLQLPQAAFSTYINDGFSNVVVGRSDGLGQTMVQTLTATDNVTLLSGAGGIGITGTVNVGSNQLTLNSIGSVAESGSGAITANKLELLGAGGNFSLAGSANDVNVLAAGNSGALIGNMHYGDSNAFTIGAAGTASGINATGTLALATSSGDLTLTHAISTTDTSSAALLLNAGEAAAAGSATGGNLVLNGGSISVGSGGRATLMSGGVAGSSGLTALVGSGSGRFRYGSDESATNYIDALGAGSYAIYREQPTVTVTAVGASKTYDKTAYGGGNGVTYGGTLLNGDSSGHLSGTLAYGGTSQGASDAGTYTITVGGQSSALGYAVAYADAGLVIGQAPITVSSSSISKAYDGSLTAAGTATLVGGTLFGGDALAGGSFAYTDKNAGSGNKTVNVSGVTVNDGNGGGNYAVTYLPNTTSTIAPKILGATATASDKVYDGSTVASANVGLSGLVGTETLVVTNASSFNSKNVTNANLVTVNSISLQDGSHGGLAGNYAVLTGQTAAAHITPRTLAVNFKGIDKVFDGNTQASVTTQDDRISGDALTIDRIAYFDNANVGMSKNVNVSAVQLQGQDASNYRLTSHIGSTTANIESNPTQPTQPSQPTQPTQPTAVAIPLYGGLDVISDTLLLPAPMDAIEMHSVSATEKLSGGYFRAIWEAKNPRITDDLMVTQLRDATREVMGLVYVAVGRELRFMGFDFDLPSQAGTALEPIDTKIEATLLNGKVLPNWLRFNAKTLKFTALNVPSEALPAQVIVRDNYVQVLVEISEMK